MERPTVGMIGAGQLARMTQQAAVSLDVELRVFADSERDSAAQVTPGAVVGSLESFEDLDTFARGCDVVTFDHEVIDPVLLGRLTAAGHVLRPGPHANLLAQDKAEQRGRLAAAGLPVPAHEAVQREEDVTRFGDRHGWPVVVKAVRGGYDGRGVWVVEEPSQAIEILRAARASGLRLLVEEHVSIDCELAVLVARTPAGDMVSYPVVETVQRDGMLNEALVPARVPSAVAEEAVELGRRIAELTDVTGMLAVELMVAGEQIKLNELAMRPHNSGHWTIEGAATSQFENHLRAVLGWQLGDPTAVVPAVASVNLIGQDDDADPRAALPHVVPPAGVRVHVYAKSPRPGRKLGHVTAVGADLDETLARARQTADRLTAVKERT